MEFKGNRICCGTYACLNAMHDSKIEIKLFEISLSSPFAVAHFSNDYLDRLLTTFRDPNQGIDRAAHLWGYEVLHIGVKKKEELIAVIKKWILKNAMVIGPIDMGRLWYLPLANMYHRLDHYITLHYCSPSSVYIVDSEGIIACMTDYETLFQALSYDGIPEASGKFHARVFRKKKEFDRSLIVKSCMEIAYQNLIDAETSGQGSHAYSKCLYSIEKAKPYQWKNSLLFDISYLLQRKELHEYLLEEYVKYYPNYEFQKAEYNNILHKQRELLRQIFFDIQNNKGITEVREYFKQLETLESGLAAPMSLEPYL